MAIVQVPLSLQDMCMLCIMLRLEEFPTDSLALLPSAIRRRLFLGLAHADLLHVDTVVLFSDLNYSGYDPSREYNRQRGPAVAREELLDVILHGSTSGSYFFSLNLEAALDCYPGSCKWAKSTPPGEFALIKHICKCYPSLEGTMVHPYFNYGVLPKRFLQFVNLHYRYSQSITCEIQVPSESAQSLLKYCKMQHAPDYLKIDCYNFEKTLLWGIFEEDRDRLRNKSPIEKIDPISPFLQNFLSNVEVLELRMHCSSMRRVPYVILYNIVTSIQPHLKHLKVHGIPDVTDRCLELTFELFSKTKKCNLSDELFNYVPSSPLPEPYPLEGLSLLVSSYHDTPGFMIINLYAQNYLASKLQSLIAFHMYTLKHVTIQGLSFRYRDFDGDRMEVIDVSVLTSLLSSSFTQLLKQPQFRSLSVGVAPLSGACTLIKTFLTTPAFHEQTLYVEGLDEQDLMEREEREDSDEDDEEDEEQEEITSDSDEDTFMVKRRRITKQRKKLPIVSLPCLTWSRNTPETNAQFKCLDLGHSSSCIHSLLFSLPELNLKKLRMRTQDMTLVPAGTTIKAEHVVFSTQTHNSYKPTISPAHLEKFTISNLVLKRLEFEEPTDECAPGLIPALIHCLSKLYQQGRGLDELVLDSIKFDDIDIREFFTTMRHLSHQHGTTLVLTPDISRHYLFSYDQRESNLFVDLGKEFQKTKIKKIVCNMRDRRIDPRPQLSPLAEEVVVYYPSGFYTRAGRECKL